MRGLVRCGMEEDRRKKRESVCVCGLTLMRKRSTVASSFSEFFFALPMGRRKEKRRMGDEEGRKVNVCVYVKRDVSLLFVLVLLVV